MSGPTVFAKGDRNTIFVSHANPEDNEFARWLSLRLMAEGYDVWCDVLRLKGGEPFWDDIDDAIRHKSAKFVFVATQASNTKPGPKRELSLARTIQRQVNDPRFIIPLFPFDLAYADANILFHELNGIAFQDSWSKGLSDLLERLEDDEVPKQTEIGPEAAASWWRANFSAEFGVRQDGEQYWSNWFDIRSVPLLRIHTVYRTTAGPIELAEQLPVPALLSGITLYSFANREEIETSLAISQLHVHDTQSFRLRDYIEGDPNDAGVRQRNGCVRSLLKECWLSLCASRAMPRYELANRVVCCYFTTSILANSYVRFQGVTGKMAERAMIGYRTVGARKRWWHFAVEAKPLFGPKLAYSIKPHVLFSDDAAEVWASKRKMQAARMSQCKNWWNREWRDKTLAAMAWFADGGATISIAVADGLVIEVASRPLILESPVGYTDPQGLQDAHSGDEDGDPNLEIETDEDNDSEDEEEA